jgi:hypothetical protein
MYKVIGSDGKIYGPVTADTLRLWMAQGRANANTLAQLDGENDWRPLSSMPQFAVPPPMSMPPTPIITPRQNNNLAVMGLVSGLLGCICCCCGLPFGLLGLVLSLIALMDAEGGDRAIAIAGLVLSILSLGMHLLAPLLNLAAMPWALHMRRLNF